MWKKIADNAPIVLAATAGAVGFIVFVRKVNPVNVNKYLGL